VGAGVRLPVQTEHGRHERRDGPRLCRECKCGAVDDPNPVRNALPMSERACHLTGQEPGRQAADRTKRANILSFRSAAYAADKPHGEAGVSNADRVEQSSLDMLNFHDPPTRRHQYSLAHKAGWKLPSCSAHN